MSEKCQLCHTQGYEIRTPLDVLENVFVAPDLVTVNHLRRLQFKVNTIG